MTEVEFIKVKALLLAVVIPVMIPGVTSGQPEIYRWVTIAGKAKVRGSAEGANGDIHFNGPQGVAVDDAGNVFVADSGNATIRMLTPDGNDWVTSTIAGRANSIGSGDGTNHAATFFAPNGVAVDSARNVFVADSRADTRRSEE
jgi:DNA-binding beta-propeller fold protein YncE